MLNIVQPLTREGLNCFSIIVTLLGMRCDGVPSSSS